MVKGGGVMPAEYYVAWWNLKNLFDEENARPDRRTEKVLRTIKNDIWDGRRSSVAERWRSWRR